MLYKGWDPSTKSRAAAAENKSSQSELVGFKLRSGTVLVSFPPDLCTANEMVGFCNFGSSFASGKFASDPGLFSVHVTMMP